jgi:hypothetical protein
MSDIDATSESYDVDYSYAPVGMFVASFWLGSLLVGLVAFLFSCLTAKGIAPYIIAGQRTWFTNDVDGVVDGVLVMLVLFLLSVGVGLAGRMATLKKRKLDGLWKLAIFAIPATATILAVASIFVHP